MTNFRCSSPFRVRPFGLMTTAAVAVVLAGTAAHAFEVGHSRLLSASGEPLRISIPLTQLHQNDLDSLRITPAELPAWQAAQLSPPVALSSLEFSIEPGHTPNSRLIQVSSSQVLEQPIADLLIDIHTAQGTKRHQVSLLASRGGPALATRKKVAAPLADSETTSTTSPAPGASADGASTALIIVRPGDTMTAIAQRHAVTGVSMYQLMMALQRANPDAFINDNVNLVKAESRLAMPDSEALTALSDREARRLFHQHLVAYTQGTAIEDVAAMDTHQPTQIQQSPDTSDEAAETPDSRQATEESLNSVASSEAQPSLDAAAEALADDNEETFTDEILENGVSDSGVSTETTTADIRHDELRLSRAPTATHPSPSFSDFERHWQTGQPGDLLTPPPHGMITAHSVSDIAPETHADGDAEPSVASEPDYRDDDAVATDKALTDAKQRVSQLEENVKNLNKALQSQGSAAHEAVLEGAASLRQSFGEVADAVSDVAQSIEREFSDDPIEEDVTDADTALDASGDASEKTPVATATKRMESWVNKHMNGVLLGGLGVIILLLVWILRLLSRRKHDAPAAITPEMVQEKLDQINLDLQEPTVDSSQKSS